MSRLGLKTNFMLFMIALLNLLSFNVSASTKQSFYLPYLSKNMPVYQKKIIINDFAFLDKLHFPGSKLESKNKLLGAPSSDEFKSWLKLRTRFIVEEEFNLTRNLKPSNHILKFPNNIIVYKKKEPVKPKKETLTIMSNLGYGIYSSQKFYNHTFTTHIDEKKIIVASPRIGLFKIGAGLFTPLIKGSNLNNAANKIDRLGTYFHEARHTDGNGHNLGFTHEICPKGHELEGNLACDNYTNGAYATGALFIKNMLKRCKPCTESEKQALRVEIADNINRIISNFNLNEIKQQKNKDLMSAANKKLALVQAELCIKLVNNGVDIKKLSICDFQNPITKKYNLKNTIPRYANPAPEFAK